MALTAAEFTERLRTTGLLEEPAIAQDLAQLVAEAPSSDADQLAGALVERGRLTPYQASVLREGRLARLLLGKYVILEKVGVGGMGQVFRARHRYMDRVVALKTLPGTLADTPEAVARFQREARAAAQLDHPNIVTAFDADEFEGVPFLAMELVEGTDLALVLRRNGPLPVEQAVDAVRQAAEALAYAHARGIIHRDVKPSNLLRDRRGTVKVLDMGLARLVQAAGAGGDPSVLTATGRPMGTIDYMSPEQAEDMRRADARSDIYSLGCTLWTLLTGRAVYEGDSAPERLVGHVEGPIPSLRSVRRDVPEGLDRLFQRMVAKRPEDRPQSMAEVSNALAAPQPLAGAGPRTRKFPVSKRVMLWTAAGALLVAVALFAGWLVPRPAAEDTAATVGIVELDGNHSTPPGAPPPAIAPFDAAAARKHQEVWAEYLDLPVEYTNSIGMEFVLIPPGELMMGSPDSCEDALHYEKPQRRVHITRPFYLGKHEVTQEQWHAVMGSRPSFFKGPQNPVERVSWNDCQEFLERLNDLERDPWREPRLPTEAQWEYACRAGTTSRYSFGDRASELDPYAWYGGNSARRSHAVGQKQPNAWGLYDMHGNVSEWCVDWFDSNGYTTSPAADPQGPAAGSSRVHRGGSWFLDAAHSRSAYRGRSTPGFRYFHLGFRVALMLRGLPQLHTDGEWADAAPAGTMLAEVGEPGANVDDVDARGTVPPRLIADSVAQFSGVQGQDNWYYGYYDGTGEVPYSQEDFTEFPRSPWRISDRYWTQMSKRHFMPNSPNTTGGKTRVEHWAVRRWVSDFEGSVLFQGTLKKSSPDAVGDGVTGRIVVDGEEVWSQFIAAGDNEGVQFSIRSEVDTGSTIDFSVAPNRNDWDDSTIFTIQIFLLPPESETASEPPTR